MIVFAHPTPASLIAGFAMTALGELFRSWGVMYVGSETRVRQQVGASRLITSGPFAHVRNPLYVGNIVIYLGIGAMSFALFPWLQLAALVYFIIQYRLIVREEERFLKEQFGAQYEEYARSVPRFLVRLTPYRSPNPHTIEWSAGWSSEMRTLQAVGAVTLIIIAIYILR